MNLIIVLLLAAVAWYLLSGLGTRQRVGGGGANNRDFRVNTNRGGETGQNTTMRSQTDNTSNQQSHSQSNMNLVQPEDAQQKGGQPSVSSSTGKAVTSPSQNGQAWGGNQQPGAALQSSTYNYGEDSGTLASMQDQTGSSITNWETPGLTSGSNATRTGGASNTLATGNGVNTTTPNTTSGGLTSEINHLYDGTAGTYGTSLDTIRQTNGSYDYDYQNSRYGGEIGMTGSTTTELRATTGDTNSYQPQETGFTDATTTDENGQPETKVTSIEDKRNKKKS